MRAETMMEKTRLEYEAYVKRADYLSRVELSKDKVERSRWRENLPQLQEEEERAEKVG